MPSPTEEPCAHIIYTPFTGVGLQNGYRGDDWFKHRIEVFKNYTLASLKNQTNKDFIHWFTFRPQEFGNPLVGRLHEAMKDYPHVFSYWGLIYWDDKYPVGTKKRLINYARIVRNHLTREKRLKGLFQDLIDSNKNRNKDLKERLTFNLRSLQSQVPAVKWIYLTRIDSDDMLHKDAVKTIQEQPPALHKALTMKKGYVYKAATGELAEWNPTTNPPFHTIIYPYETFFDASKHLEYISGFKSHEDVPQVFDSEHLPNYLYSYVIHGEAKKDHISTMWEHPFAGPPVRKKVSGQSLAFESHEDITKLFNCQVLPDHLYCVNIHSRDGIYRQISTEWDQWPRGELIDKSNEILKDFGI